MFDNDSLLRDGEVRLYKISKPPIHVSSVAEVPDLLLRLTFMVKDSRAGIDIGYLDKRRTQTGMDQTHRNLKNVWLAKEGSKGLARIVDRMQADAGEWFISQYSDSEVFCETAKEAKALAKSSGFQLALNKKTGVLTVHTFDPVTEKFDSKFRIKLSNAPEELFGSSNEEGSK